ncbi:hypothetical protein GC56T2_0713 [Geobacillus sp. C56-T2]|nr:hypothetical protein GC56T2_0713 [Geobacillus sp. C56-T2]
MANRRTWKLCHRQKRSRALTRVFARATEDGYGKEEG